MYIRMGPKTNSQHSFRSWIGWEWEAGSKREPHYSSTQPLTWQQEVPAVAMFLSVGLHFGLYVNLINGPFIIRRWGMSLICSELIKQSKLDNKFSVICRATCVGKRWSVHWAIASMNKIIPVPSQAWGLGSLSVGSQATNTTNTH